MKKLIFLIMAIVFVSGCVTQIPKQKLFSITEYEYEPVTLIECSTDACCQENFEFRVKYDSEQNECVISPTNELLSIEQRFIDEYPICNNNINKIFNPEGEKLMLFFNKNCELSGVPSKSDYWFMEFIRVPNFCTNWYLNPDADFLDSSDQDLWTITETIKYNKKVYIVTNSQFRGIPEFNGIMDGYYWCENPDLLGFASNKELLDDYFEPCPKISPPLCADDERLQATGYDEKGCTLPPICVKKEECNYYYWFDRTKEVCGYKKFCGQFVYQGLKIFNTLEECNSELEPKEEPAPPEKTFFDKYGLYLIIAGFIGAIIYFNRK